MIRIFSTYLSHADTPYQVEMAFHPGETIRYNVVHMISPHEDVRYRIYGRAERLHLTGLASDYLRLETVWRPARTYVLEGNYSHAWLLTSWVAGTIPTDPYEAFDDSIAGVPYRTQAMSDLAAGEHFLEFSPGYWTFTAFLGLVDPADPDEITDFVERGSEPYVITRP